MSRPAPSSPNTSEPSISNLPHFVPPFDDGDQALVPADRDLLKKMIAVELDWDRKLRLERVSIAAFSFSVTRDSSAAEQNELVWRLYGRVEEGFGFDLHFRHETSDGVIFDQQFELLEP